MRATYLRAVFLAGACLSACTASPTRTAARPADAQIAAQLRVRGRSLAGEGKLRRAVRVFAKANGLDRAGASSTWDVEVQALAELGRDDDARALIARTFASEAAPAQAKSAATRALAALGESAKLARAKGAALVKQALAAKRGPDAQRLLDRAIVALEGETRGVLHVETTAPPGTTHSIAWSPDGATLAVGRGATIVILDATTGDDKMTLVGHAGEVWGLAYSRDGKMLASVGADGAVLTWDAATGAMTGLYGRPAAWTYGVAFNADGSVLATGDSEGKITIWSTEKKASVRKIDAHPKSINLVAFSPDGTVLASASQDHSVKIWDPATGKELKQLTLDDDVWGLSFNADGSRLAGGDNTGKVTVWDTSSWTAIDGAGGKLDSPLWGLGFGGDDSAVVAADWHSIKDLTADNAFSVAKHDGIGGRFAVDPKTRKRIAARDYSDGTVTVLDWDDAHASSSFTPAWAYGTHWASPVADARFDPTGRIVVTLGDDGSVDAWSDTVRALTVAHEAAVPRCSIAVAAGRLATTSKESGGTDVWDLVSGAKVLSIPARVGATYAVDLNRAGNTLATLSRRTDDSTPIVTMSLYDAQGTLLQTRDLAATDEGSSATCVRFGPTPNTLTLLDARPRARRFTLELQRDSDDEEMVDWRAAIDASQRLAKITDTGVEIRGADAARRLLRRIPTQATRVAWSPDGTQLATSESDGTTHLWASEARSLLLGIYGGASPSLRIPSPMGADAVRSVDFSPSGAILAVATASGATNLFRLPGGSLALSLRSVADAAGRVAMTPSGHFEQLGADAGNFVRCFVGGGRVPLELCEETFEVRGLVAKVLADDASYEEP